MYSETSISDNGPDSDAVYWDHRFQRRVIKLLPGDFEVVNNGQMMVTILGSCVSACIRDKIQSIGGMNHFLLPGDQKTSARPHWDYLDSAAARYGDLAMEKLINNIIKLGGKRENLEAKVFGGANMFNSGISTNIGEQNVQFVKEYLDIEKINIMGMDTGGDNARKIYYIPQTGEVFLKRIDRSNNNTIQLRESQYLKQAKATRTTAEISFFD
jgi:chemotaxis protein CheD